MTYFEALCKDIQRYTKYTKGSLFPVLFFPQSVQSHLFRSKFGKTNLESCCAVFHVGGLEALPLESADNLRRDNRNFKVVVLPALAPRRLLTFEGNAWS